MVNIYGENLHIFGTTWGISMKFSGKMKDVTYDKIKSHNKPGLHPHSIKYI